MSKIVAMVCNSAWSMYNFRLGVIKALLEQGYQIVVVAPQDKFSEKLEMQGCSVYNINIENKGTNPIKDLRTIYDFYSGTGSISIYIAANVKEIYGFESINDATINAKDNAKINSITNAKFYTIDLIKIQESEIFSSILQANNIIINPPRAGMHKKTVEWILRQDFKTIVYVSCNPSTQARDVSLLSEKYKLIKMQAVDMFPYTQHIENVVQMKNKF